MANKDFSETAKKVVDFMFATNERGAYFIALGICLITLIWMIDLVPVESFQSGVGVGFIYFVTLICMTLVIRPFMNPIKRLYCRWKSSKA
tara:strand:- start:1212 stop:1481 length:270 start_codon:yes stop_codon:yes gene_type:complete